jgi:hypothetical protein
MIYVRGINTEEGKKVHHETIFVALSFPPSFFLLVKRRPMLVTFYRRGGIPLRYPFNFFGRQKAGTKFFFGKNMHVFFFFETPPVKKGGESIF